jgi:predicted Zn finger-like uncharacterized protein
VSEYGSVTQCPHCKTSFHVGPIQLEAANGAVRCGGCLKVFDALEHFIVEQKPLFGGKVEDWNGDAESGTKTEPEQEFYNPRADDDEDILAFSQDPDEDETAELSAGTLDEDTGEAPDEALNEEFSDADAASETIEEVAATAEEDFKNQDQNISDILEESLAQLEDNLAVSSGEDSPIAEDESKSRWESVLAVRPRSEEEPPLSDLAKPKENEEEKLAEQLFVGSKNRKAYKKISTPWTICISILFMALLAQSLYWQPASLREVDFYNRVSINYCALFPCRELVLQDLSQLYVSGIVRPSTKYNNSLAVLVELRNRADFSQRFPYIELAFTDLRGEKISLRRFSPREYLRAETAGRTMLQPFQRIQIELELYDPGTSAISYGFNLLYLN